MNKKTQILLVGIGGFGNVYVDALLDSGREDISIAGYIDPSPEGCRRLDELTAAGIPHFESIEAFFEKDHADLTIIASPIHYHPIHTIAALKNGSNVLCEKPLCGSLQDGLAMLEAEEKSEHFVAIGYQGSFNTATLTLKEIILSGRLGKPLRLKTRAFRPRTDKYYMRNRWAGRLRDDNGRWVLDSVANNATAHYLHHMLFVLGKGHGESADLSSIEAELYRANDIESFDTAALRVVTANGAEILYYVSHAVSEFIGPSYNFQFEHGTVSFNESPESDTGNLLVHFADGSTVNCGNPSDDGLNKLWASIDAVSRKTAIPCGIRAAIKQTAVINGAHLSSPGIKNLPEDQIEVITSPDGSKLRAMTGLADSLHDCYEKALLPSEAGFPWAEKGKKVSLSDLSSLSLNTLV